MEESADGPSDRDLMSAQRGSFIGESLRLTFDELSARRIYPNFPRMKVLMRARKIFHSESCHDCSNDAIVVHHSVSEREKRRKKQ